MTPDALRSLADQATPGPWQPMPYDPLTDSWDVMCGEGDFVSGCTEQDARLLALAPVLARLAADMADALDETHDLHDALAEDFHAKHPESDGEAEDCIVCRIGALLARFRSVGETP